MPRVTALAGTKANISVSGHTQPPLHVPTDTWTLPFLNSSSTASQPFVTK